ncbi:MAG: transferase [delta proteobacterium ML8_F1]|nr:MAG: transferase [delta proteobacterium ML8_F1]
MKIKIFDSTLRDGAQGEGISFSVTDKLKIVKVLDDLGIHYIESGNPGSNEKDRIFFKEVKKMTLKQARLVAFGSTRRKGIEACEDDNVLALLEAQTEVVCIFGKSWDLHVEEILKTSLEENLRMIEDTVAFFKEKGREVVFDAEHFFDGYKANPGYAIKTLESAREAGADVLVLCDTNGGTYPTEIQEIVLAVGKIAGTTLGIHVHDDMGLAVANSLLAVEAGATHVQGTLTGFGERCGNANLSAIIPNLQLKRGFEVLTEAQLENLARSAREVNNIANIPLSNQLPYVGRSAFSHKGGMHIDGVAKVARSFEHVDPDAVGNRRRYLMSEMSGKTSVFSVIQRVDPRVRRDSETASRVLDKLKELEYEGYQFEGAESSFELIVRKLLGVYKPAFEIAYFKTIDETAASDLSASSIIKIRVKGSEEITAAQGNGPVNAMDLALRKALLKFYPCLDKMKLKDYKVRVLDGDNTTAAKVRVLIESTNGKETWGTVGVSTNIMEASLKALVDSIEYNLLKEMG